MKTLKSKEQLEKSSQEYWEAVQEDIHALIDRAKSMITGAVVIGVGFWLAYQLFRRLYSGSENDPGVKEQHSSAKTEEPSVLTIIKQTILKELALFLLSIVKEKVIEYLQETHKDEEDS